MNREIKFRGYSIKENKWKYGYLSKYNNKHGISDDMGIGDFVYKESIGEYTGLKDKNGVEIYEGDIIQTKDFYECGELVFKGEMEVVKDLNYYINGCVFIDTSGEVVGNVYENPELLEVK